MGHVETTQQPNPRLWPKSLLRSHCPWNSRGGEQGSKEEKEEECQAQEVPTGAEGS